MNLYRVYLKMFTMLTYLQNINHADSRNEINKLIEFFYLE